MIVLDTNVVSELMRAGPAPGVANWVRERDRRELRTTTITLAEVRYGIARLPDGRRKQLLLTAADESSRPSRTRFSRWTLRPRSTTRPSRAAGNGPGNRSRGSTH